MRACLSLGSNIGDRLGYLEKGIAQIGEHPQIKITACSSVYETEPVGEGELGGNFYNMAVVVETVLSCEELMAFLLRLEFSMGRVRSGSMLPRTLDLDIILAEDRVIESKTVIVPHPRFHERRFVLAPLAEIAPEERDPATGRTVSELLEACPDQSSVVIRPGLERWVCHGKACAHCE